MTPRQMREQSVYEARKGFVSYDPDDQEKEGGWHHVFPEVKPRETAADRRNYYRKQAGWPLLKVK